MPRIRCKRLFFGFGNDSTLLKVVRLCTRGYTKIATNASLDTLDGRRVRGLPKELYARGDPTQPLPEPTQFGYTPKAIGSSGSLSVSSKPPSS